MNIIITGSFNLTLIFIAIWMGTCIFLDLRIKKIKKLKQYIKFLERKLIYIK